MRHRTYYRLSIGLALAAFGICLALPRANAQNIFYTGFENITASNQQGWIASQGLWQLSAPTNPNGPGAAYDGRICAWTGGDADGSTPVGGQSYLISPLITLPPCPVGQQIILSFWQWFSQSQNAHMSVWVTTNGVTDWQLANFGGGGYVFDGIGGAWSPIDYDLTHFQGQQIRIGFLQQGGTGDAPGWYIDDVSIDKSVDTMAVGVQGLPYSTGFENFTGSDATGAWQGWSADSGVWQVGGPTSMDGGGVFDGLLCAFTGGSQGDAVSNSISTLISPAIGLPLIGSGRQILLTFWHWFLWQPNDGYGEVNVSVRNVETWDGWYDVTNPASGARSAYAGSSGLWSQASVDLSAYAGKQVLLGFNFWGSYNVTPGWYIDDVNVSVVPIQQPPYAWGFENFKSSPPLATWNGWSADNGVWTVGAPTNPNGPAKAYGGSQCAFTSGPGGNYTPGQGSTFVTPAMILPAVAAGQKLTLTFANWYMWDSSGLGYGKVLVSTWSTATTPPSWTAWTQVGATYSGTSGGWNLASIDLTAYSGQQIQVGFYQMGGTNPAPGWYIDDVKVVLPAPTITSFTPTKGGIGADVTVTGDFFAGATGVAFNGIWASYTVVSDTEITTTVPTGATTGPIKVTTPTGTATSAQNFTVLPTANAQTVSVDHNKATAITLTGSDPDNLPLTFAIATSPTHGALSGLNSATGAITYTPSNDFQGTDSFTFTVSDGTNTSTAAKVTLNVDAGTPTANAQSVAVAHNTAKAITLTGTDPDRPALKLSFTIASSPAHGTLGALNTSTGAVTYTPSANFHGSDSFTFTVSNGTNKSAAAKVTLNVAAGIPTANAQTVAVAHNTAKVITLTGTDPDNPALKLTFAIVTSPAHGSLGSVNKTTGAVTYTPSANFQGADSFTFTVNNGTNKSAAAKVTLNVAAGIPTANAQTVAVAHNTAKVITLTGTDPDNPALKLTFAIVTPPAHGSLGSVNKTTGAVTYTPSANYHGADSFTFTVSNGTNTSTAAKVTLTVAAGIPTANAQTVAVAHNTAKVITLTGTDPDNPALKLTFAIVTPPAHGSLGSVNKTTGAVTYTPSANFQGADSFTFTVNNGTNKSAAAKVTLTVGGGG